MQSKLKFEKKPCRVIKPSNRFVPKIKLERMSNKLVQIVQQFPCPFFF